MASTRTPHAADPGHVDASGVVGRFRRAVRAHLSGDAAGAESGYRAVLAEDPRHAESLNNLATLVAARGAHGEAAALLAQAIERDPHYAEAWHNLGLVHNATGDHARAHEAFSRAVHLEPANADWVNDLGNACIELLRYEDALRAYDAAIALRPAEATFWNNRGIALRGVARPDDALEAFHRAQQLDQGHVNALSNIGVLHREQRRYDRAIVAFERAIALAPGSAPLHANFASVYEAMGDFERMAELARTAVALDPAYAEGYTLLANYELEAGRIDAAERLYWRSVALDPDNRNGNWNLAIIWLLRGEFERGWEQFEWRKKLHAVLTERGLAQGPEWDGSPLAGRTILVATEQGMGDAIQFIRYARELKRAGAGRVIVECPYPLQPLLASVEGVDEVIARGMPLPAYDTHVSLMSLPHLLGTTLESIPASVPYIHAESRPAADVVAAPPGVLKVGIVWAGNPLHPRDALRSTPLKNFRTLLDVPGTQFYSIQKGDGAERQVAELGDPRLVDLAPHLGDFRDTAAVIERLDLVIAVDTSVAHLAGAMGKPTWVLLPSVPDYRWLLDRTDSPWYPSAKLFRQEQPRRWDDVFEALAAELRRVTAATDPGQPAASGQAVPDPMITTLESATRRADGRPRFDLWIPIARLTDPAWFAAYEAELVHGGHLRAVRDFWDEAAQCVDVVIDLTPGPGLLALSVATGPRPPRQVIAVVPDEEDARRLGDIASRRVPGGRLRVVPDAAEALALAKRQASATIGVHAGSRDDIDAFLAAWSAEPREGMKVEVATVAAPAPCRAADWDAIAPGLAGFAMRGTPGEVVVEPLPDDAAPDADRAWISASALARLGVPLQTASHRNGAAAVSRPSMGIDWEIRGDTGWGVYGTNLALELVRRGELSPAIFAVEEGSLHPMTAFQLSGALRDSAALRGARGAMAFDGLMLRALGNGLRGGPLWERVVADRNVGVVFFEDTHFDREALARARSLDLIVAGCEWNAEVLRGTGVSNVVAVRQGIDPTVFHPAARSGQFDGRFVVFSGGKLEFRKGQDLVVAAFRRFRERHPEALLLTAWHNPWPQLIADLDLAGHVRGMPRAEHGALQVREWLAANGIPVEATFDVGRQPNAFMGSIIREADVAVFPNRCEGGTNLVAMECMASGIPTIVSANTGQLDLVATGGCIPLSAQGRVPSPTRFFRATEGWGESSVDEIVEALEAAWRDREAAEAVARRGVDAMQDWTWPRQIDRLLSTLKPLIHQA